MITIDRDLLSIQEGRILVEEARKAKDCLVDKSQRKLEPLLEEILSYFKNNINKLSIRAQEETSYGVAEDEYRLCKYFLDNIHKDFEKYQKPYEVSQTKNGESFLLSVPKGICLGLISPYLSLASSMQLIIFAIKTHNPLIFIAEDRCHNIVKTIVNDVKNIIKDKYYPEGLVGFLDINSKAGKEELLKSPYIDFIIESSFIEASTYKADKDIFVSEIGNNVVFIDKSADLEKACREIVRSKSFNNGLTVGVEQAVVVEASVFNQVKELLHENGAYFLTKDEHIKMQAILYDDYQNVRKELVGRSAKELGHICGIAVPDDCKILVVNKPYVSVKSPYSREKYMPVISMYAEDDWLNACEKCIELLLNDKKGQSLSIYSNDAHVIEEFIEKKPVARVLVNTTTGLGSMGLGSSLPLSFFITTDKQKGHSQNSLTINHFYKFKEIAIGSKESLDEFLKEYRQNKANNELFNQVLFSINNKK
ncbi:aldehyde dehydrogenase family protein [uncultured Anaerococcus sp.]|uniref:aldehyde dehydrogenase family protein n=1 Tax=uncultured Anaerococcus sp. TaxID=293428 RepID=UPI0028893CC0|nr:aldehyde dehydrogenase family protein [uncultured Anaerococcus sp.]